MQDRKENSSFIGKQELFFIQLPISFQTNLTKEQCHKGAKEFPRFLCRKLYRSLRTERDYDSRKEIVRWCIEMPGSVYGSLPQSIVSKSPELQSGNRFPDFVLQEIETTDALNQKHFLRQWSTGFWCRFSNFLLRTIVFASV